MGELPGLGKLWRRLGGDEEASLKLRHSSLNYRGEQRKNEKRLGSRSGLLLSAIATFFDRTAPIAFTIFRG